MSRANHNRVMVIRTLYSPSRGQLEHSLAMNHHEIAGSGRPQGARVCTGPKSISYLVVLIHAT